MPTWKLSKGLRAQSRTRETAWLCYQVTPLTSDVTLQSRSLDSDRLPEKTAWPRQWSVCTRVVAVIAPHIAWIGAKMDSYVTERAGQSPFVYRR